MPSLRPPPRSAATDPYRVRRTISQDARETVRLHHAATSLETSNLEDGGTDNYRFGNLDEQRTRNHRSPLAFWFHVESDRRAYPSPIGHPFHDRILRWVYYGPTVRSRYASSHPVRIDLPGSSDGEREWARS